MSMKSVNGSTTGLSRNTAPRMQIQGPAIAIIIDGQQQLLRIFVTCMWKVQIRINVIKQCQSKKCSVKKDAPAPVPSTSCKSKRLELKDQQLPFLSHS